MISQMPIPVHTTSGKMNSINVSLFWSSAIVPLVLLVKDMTILYCTVLMFDRFLIIVFPFRYHKIMTNKVVIGFVAGSWLIGFILCSFALFDLKHEGKYTRNGFCHTDTILSRLIAIVFPNVVATFLAVIQIACLSFKANKSAREHQRRQSLSGKKIKGIAHGHQGICTLILLVWVAGVLGVIIPIILGLTHILFGNETTAAKIVQNGVVPFFGKMSTISSLWILSDRPKEDYIQDCGVFDELFLLLLLLFWIVTFSIVKHPSPANVSIYLYIHVFIHVSTVS